MLVTAAYTIELESRKYEIGNGNFYYHLLVFIFHLSDVTIQLYEIFNAAIFLV